MEKMFKAKMAKQQQMSMKPSESPSNAAATIMSEMGGSLRGRSMQTAEER
jgi:hypothetical protein